MRLPLAILLASMLLHNEVFAQSADAVFAPGDALRERAEKADAALLAPRDYLKGVQALERARAAFDAGGQTARLERQLGEAAAAFEAALASCAIAEVEFADALDARVAANDAEAFRLAANDWTRAERSFSDAVRALEKKDLERARERGALADAEFRQAELNAIEARVLGEARRSLVEAEAARADRHAPRTLATARALLAEGEAALAADRYALDEPRRLAEEASRQARQARYIAGVGERLRRKDATLEDVILDWQAPLENLAEVAGRPVDFSNGYGAVENALRDELERIPVLEQDLAESRRQVLGLEDEIRDLDAQLGGANAERSQLIRRLEAQARVREQCASVSALYAPEEAVVLRDGDNLILRMVGLSFPSGSSQLDENAVQLLSRLADAADVFPRSRFVVEGHTDTTGSAGTNLKLSQSRAQAVADFLTTELGIQGFRIRAEGFGDSRPIANNRTAEGRARNRRIDVRILATN